MLCKDQNTATPAALTDFYHALEKVHCFYTTPAEASNTIADDIQKVASLKSMVQKYGRLQSGSCSKHVNVCSVEWSTLTHMTQDASCREQECCWLQLCHVLWVHV